MTKQIQKEEIKIRCSHCNTVVDSVWLCKVESVIGLRYIYICSNCKTNLGTYHSRNLLKENPALRAAIQ
jgi:DNA-directed RNA polymerase subunit RPC12/RpoP